MKNILQKCRFSNLKSITAKVFLTFAVLISGQQLFAQLFDDYSDGEFTSNPAWLGSASKFVIESGMLRLNASPSTDVGYLATPSTSINDASWEFLVRLDFNPSTTNFARIYLVSDNADLTSSLNGYFVELGNTADDVSLYKQSGTTTTRIIDGQDGKLDVPMVMLRIKIIRDRDGTWEVYSDSGATGTYVIEGTVKDNTHLSSEYFGVLCSYTSTRSDKFYFDDISVRGDGSPDITPTPAPAHFKDVIITEIFADPSPKVSLPDIEFVEILNRSENSISLDGWSLGDGSSTLIIKDVVLPSAGFLIISSNPSLFALDLNSFGSSDFPSLNNSGDNLILRDATGKTIDSLHYSIDWYRDNQKKDGGWSLELIDPENICAEGENWIASEHTSGGTPGLQNSVHANKPDLMGPALRSAIPLSPFSIRLFFNEKLQAEVPLPENFVISPPVVVKSVSFSSPSHGELLLETINELSDGISYSITVSSIADCAGNRIQEVSNNLIFGLPGEPMVSDVLINEILFDPRPAGVDFVEIVNNSGKFFNLKNWTIGNFENDTITNASTISSKDHLLPPGGYVVITEDLDLLKGDYSSSIEQNIVEIADMPSLNDDAGSIAIAAASHRIVDHFNYSKALHSIFIKDPEGVTLERISLDVATNDPQNWKSASTISGHATPGYPNSNSRDDLQPTDYPIQIEPEVFLPLNGQPDFVLVHYDFDRGGYVANVKVFDSQGGVVKQLANNEILGTQGVIRWDGDRSDGSKARVGYYLIVFEVFDDRGAVRTYFNRVAVATRF